MSTRLATIVLFGVGSVLGFSIAADLFRWIASGAGYVLAGIRPTEAIIAQFQFALACGISFGTAPIVSDHLSPRRLSAAWISLYLLIGCVVSAASAAYHQHFMAEIYSRLGPEPTGIALASYGSMPTFSIPLSGAAAMVVTGLLLRGLGRLKGKHADAEMPA